MLEEKERLLKLLEQRDLINIRGREDTEKKIDAQIDYTAWTHQKDSVGFGASKMKTPLQQQINELTGEDRQSSSNSKFSPLRRKIKY